MSHQRLVSIVINRRMLVAFVMGFSCGLPLPYTLKFFWSPLFDRYTLPFLGRRRGWLLASQLSLMASLVWLGFSNPAAHPELLVLSALAVAFFSASQDIVVDAYRREDLPDRELGLGSSLYINGYRVGMLLASGGGLILADHMSFSLVYLIMALCLLPGLITTILTPEPHVASFPMTLKAAVVDPLVEYFSRTDAMWILIFILMYKIGDTMAAAMTIPFYLDIGFSKTQIGTVVKLFGFWATVAGTLFGGMVMIRLGIIRSLWVFGILQALSTAGFALLATIGPNLTALSAVISFENLSGGMGTSAYAAYMASITDKRFTATQYALLTSLMGIPRVLASAPTGYLATHMGWEGFFMFCTVIALPGLILILRISGKRQG
ncbi:MAG: AmpG family muropeptide MFS transporter [Desulfosarcina sp.]|nr:AmpG family muropeptide MFS transporter [Desulfosarcina sp.]